MRFDEALVERLARVGYEAEEKALCVQRPGLHPFEYKALVPASRERLLASVRANLTELSRTHAVVPRVRIESARHAIDSYRAFNCEGNPGDCGRLTYMAGEYLKLIAEMEVSLDV